MTPGERRGDRVAVVKGLSAGNQVVTSGQLKLLNGTQVQVDTTPQPIPDVTRTNY